MRVKMRLRAACTASLAVTFACLLACFACPAAFALIPSKGQELANGEVVEGKCKSSFGQATGVGEQWTLSTDDPQRAHAAAGTTLAPMEIAPRVVPYGDFQLAGEAVGEHSDAFAVDKVDPQFSIDWGWKYLDEWAVNFQGGSTPGSQSSGCSGAYAEDTSEQNHPYAPLGSYAGAFPGESVAQGHGLVVQRPGPYAIDQWILTIQYEEVATAEFEAKPFLPTSCKQGTAVLNENPQTEEEWNAAFYYLHGVEASYRISAPQPKGLVEWEAKTYCLEGYATPFVVDGAQGEGNYSGDESQPSSPYVNQYAAGTHLKLPPAAYDSRPGATASGPSSLLMGMRAALGASKPASWFPALKAVYERTVDSNRDFDPEPAVKLLKELGWTQAVATPLEGDVASVADAGPPYPIAYPNASNEAAVDKALQSGPVALDTELGTDEWGKTGGGHVILIVGIDPQQPGQYVVDDPAGNYFSSPTGHYASTSYGYGVDYPKAWVLAYATNTLGRGMIAFGPHTGDPAVIDISDAEPGGQDAPTSFYLQSGSGRRTGWINGQPINEIANSFAGQNTPWSQDVAGGQFTPEGEAAGPFGRFLIVPEPTSDMALHLVGGSSGKYALVANAGNGGQPVAGEQLHGTAAAGTDSIVASPALQAIVKAPAPTATEPHSPSTTANATTNSAGGGSSATSTTGAIGVASQTVVRLSAAQLRALLRGEIVPPAKSAGIASLKKRGVLSLSFHAPEGGGAVVSWYELALGARLSAKPKPLLVARGALSFSGASTRRLAMHLTPAGVRLLKRSRRLALTAKGSFAPRGGAVVTATRAFVLK
jgi:hypothetical protein